MTLDHRKAVGGLWQQMGWYQFGYLIGAGLKPWHYLLDVGCGSLRGGRLFIKYLHPGHYYGLDKETRLIDAGLDELGQGLFNFKKPHLFVTDSFDLSNIHSDVEFDFALAQSVFTHLSPGKVKLCVCNVLARKRGRRGFHATYFKSGDGKVWLGNPHAEGGGELVRAAYPFSFFRKLDGVMAMDVGEIGHPRGQQMVVLKNAL